MNIARLAWYYLRFHKAKTAILVVCIGLTVYLPVTSHWLVAEFDARMTARAGAQGATPLVIGVRGSRFDLVLHALNFRPLPEGSEFGAAELEQLRRDGLATPVPLFIHDYKHKRGRAFPIVGTTLDYLDFRRLGFSAGGSMTLLGDCVLGADAARALGAGVGDTVTPDPASLADLTSLPLKMRVTGVLARTHTADDHGIFTNLKTAWIIAGHGHGHDSGKTPGATLPSEGNTTVFNAALVTAEQVNPDNITGFHFHDSPDKLPLTAIIVLPHSEGDSVILQGQDRFLRREAPLQALAPAAVVGEMLEVVLRAKQFIDANQAAVAVCTGLFLVLVVMLSLRLRRGEMETMFQLGCSRATMFWLQATELGIIAAASTGLAMVAAWLTLDYVDGLMRGMGI
jgi:putative ABC transport system permease protein